MIFNLRICVCVIELRGEKSDKMAAVLCVCHVCTICLLQKIVFLFVLQEFKKQLQLN